MKEGNSITAHVHYCPEPNCLRHVMFAGQKCQIHDNSLYGPASTGYQRRRFDTGPETAKAIDQLEASNIKASHQATGDTAVIHVGIEATLAERGARYGAFREHAVIAQNIQNVMRNTEGWNRLAPDQKQALTVIADKIARMLNGDPNYIDNWHDIIGYAKLVEDRLNEEATSGSTDPVCDNRRIV